MREGPAGVTNRIEGGLTGAALLTGCFFETVFPCGCGLGFGIAGIIGVGSVGAIATRVCRTPITTGRRALVPEGLGKTGAVFAAF